MIAKLGVSCSVCSDVIFNNGQECVCGNIRLFVKNNFHIVQTDTNLYNFVKIYIDDLGIIRKIIKTNLKEEAKVLSVDDKHLERKGLDE